MAKSRNTSPRRRKKKAITCDDCFFNQNLLCALDKAEPCPTFRPAAADGLKPPRQLSFLFPPVQPRPRLVPFKPPEFYAGHDYGDDLGEALEPTPVAQRSVG